MAISVGMSLRCMETLADISLVSCLDLYGLNLNAGSQHLQFKDDPSNVGIGVVWLTFRAAANLMIGAIGQAIPGGEKIDLGNDPELEDAKWYTHEQIREALRVGVSGLDEPPNPEYKEGNLRLPPATAVSFRWLFHNDVTDFRG